MGFAEEIQRFQEKAERRGNAIVQKVVFTIHNKVVEKSPVDTGRFRANNQIGADGPPTSVLETEDKGGQLTLSREASKIGQIKAGQNAYIANNVAYAGALEARHSGQAPQGVYLISAMEVANGWPSIVELVKQENT